MSTNFDNNDVIFASKSVSVLFSNALDLMQAEPVITFSVFAQTYDKFVWFLSHLTNFGKHVALSLWHCEDPILALVVMNTNFKAPIEKSRYNLVGREVANIV
jgi:hypothetical protein